ncbi:hypothetical protein, partial [Actinoplanes sp. NPDC005259]
LLDVDGVLNTVRPGWGGPPRRAQVWSGQDSTSYVLRWAPALMDRIRALAAEKVEIRWCTTWCPEADTLERLWRLPELGRALHADPMPRGSDCWPLKQQAARAVLVEERRRLIWTDDDALPPPGPRRDKLTGRGRALLIAPKPLRGLQPEDLNLIEKFAEGRRLPTHRVAGRHRHTAD